MNALISAGFASYTTRKACAKKKKKHIKKKKNTKKDIVSSLISKRRLIMHCENIFYIYTKVILLTLY